jgi:hypothetical protein
MLRIAIQIILLSMVGGILQAQQLPPAFARWQPERFSAIETAGDSSLEESFARFQQDDYRYEGLIFGAATLGALGAWIGSRISGPCLLTSDNDCRTDRAGNAVVLGLAGTVVGGGVGYLAGRISPKRPTPAIILHERSPVPPGIPDSIRLRTGYQHWKGAAIGTGIGAVLGGVLALVANTGCSDCTTSTGERAEAALAVTGGAAVLGFLVGLASPKYVWVHRGDAVEVDSTSNRE